MLGEEGGQRGVAGERELASGRWVWQPTSPAAFKPPPAES